MTKLASMESIWRLLVDIFTSKHPISALEVDLSETYILLLAGQDIVFLFKLLFF